MELPAAVQRAIEQLAELPSIGPRQATRLGFYLLARGRTDLEALATALSQLATIKRCETCFFIHDRADAQCEICTAPQRRQDIVMIVEKETDLITIEHAKKYPGTYLVLGLIPRSGRLNDVQRERLATLKQRISNLPTGQLSEIVVALNPTTTGDHHARTLIEELRPYAARITRLGRGLPTGGEIEFADDETIGSALTGRG